MLAYKSKLAIIMQKSSRFCLLGTRMWIKFIPKAYTFIFAIYIVPILLWFIIHLLLILGRYN